MAASAPPVTTPAPTPPPPTRRPRRSGQSRVVRATQWPIWAVARLTVRYPGRVVALTAAVTATTPVTLREVAGVVVGECCLLGAALFGGAAPDAELSLPEIAKFRQRRTRIRRRWVTVMADCGLAKSSAMGGPDKRRPRLLRVDAEPLGARLLIDGSPVSAGPDAFAGVADKLRAGLKAQSVKVNANGHNTEIHLRYDSPAHFTRPIKLKDLPRATRPLHVVVGLDEDSRPVEKDLRLPGLTIGAQGSGKSSEIWVILAALLRERIPFRLRVFDPKGGQEFRELEPVAWEYERRPTAWPQFLEHSHRTLAAKQASLRERGIHELTRFTDRDPLDVMVIDELLTALAFGRGAGRKAKVDGSNISAEDAFTLYLSTARAAGGTVLAATQLGQKEALGSGRDLFSHVTCLRVAPTAPDVVDIALGRGASKIYPAHLLSPDRRLAGIGFMPVDGEVVKYRSAHLGNDERAAVARAVGKMTARLRAAGDGGDEP